MSRYGNAMNGRRSPMGAAPSTPATTTPSAAARPRPAGTVIPAMTAASGTRTPQGHGAPQAPTRRPGALATTATYGGRHAYGAEIQARLNAARASEEAATQQIAVEAAVPDQVVIEMFGATVEPEINLDETAALLAEADALLEDLEDSTGS